MDTGSGVLKKIYGLYKNVMFQIDPLKCRYSQKQQYPERTLRLKVHRESRFLEKVASKCSFEIGIELK